MFDVLHVIAITLFGILLNFKGEEIKISMGLKFEYYKVHEHTKIYGFSLSL